jgi:hypothetical protein
VERIGIVYIAASYPQMSDRPSFTGYWDRGEPPELLEDGPGWNSVDDAITWGKARAPRVLVRLGSDDTSVYSAGDLQAGSYPQWPPEG